MIFQEIYSTTDLPQCYPNSRKEQTQLNTATSEMPVDSSIWKENPSHD
jgi:hypothetical protein